MTTCVHGWTLCGLGSPTLSGTALASARRNRRLPGGLAENQLPDAASGVRWGRTRLGVMQIDSGEVPRSGLRHNRNWRLLWLGQAVSLVGDFVFNTTVVLWVATVIADGQSWAPLAVGAVLIAAAAPILLIGPFAGVFVDRWDRRRTMLAADLIRAALIASLLVLPALGDRASTALQLTVVYTVVALTSSVGRFFNPARFALLGAVVVPADRAGASGQSQAAASFAAIIGPPLAAPLLFSLGVQWALGINAASYLVSYLAVQAIRVPPVTSAEGASTDVRFGRELREGLRFFRRSPVLVTVCLSGSVAMMGVGALNALDVFFVTDNLHTSARWLGTLGAAFGAGSVAGALAAGAVASRVGAGRVYWVGLILAGFGLFAYSRTSTLPVAIVALFLAGMPVTALHTVAGPLVLRATPQHLIGRVMAVMSPAVQLAAIASMAVAAAVASTTPRGFHADVLGLTVGRIDAIFAVSAVLLVLAGLVAWPPMRRADRAAALELDRRAPAPVRDPDGGGDGPASVAAVLPRTTDPTSPAPGEALSRPPRRGH